MDRFRAAREAGLALRPRDFEKLAVVPRWELDALVTRTKADPRFRRLLLRGAAGFVVAALGFTAPVSADEGAAAGKAAGRMVAMGSDDADADGRPDWWEAQHFGSADTYVGADDPDGDGFTNRVEYLWGTDPDDVASVPASDPDLDKDGLPDDWEDTYLGSGIYDADDDPDGDTYTNFEEYYWNSDPDDALSIPRTAGPAYGCTAVCRASGSGTFALALAWVGGFLAWLKRKR